MATERGTGEEGASWKAMGRETNTFFAECGSLLLLKGQEQEKIPADPAQERQEEEGIQAQWQQESPFREALDADADGGTQTCVMPTLH